MKDSGIALNAVLDLVPQWYRAQIGKFEHSLAVKDDLVRFYSHRPLTPQLSAFLEAARVELPHLIIVSRSLSPVAARAFIQEFLAKIWLQQRAPKVNWGKLINYLSELADRTYENERVSCNLIVGDGVSVTSIDDPDVQRVFDPLATSLQTFIRVNFEIDFVAYEEIPWESIKDTKEYKYSPEFLQPVASALKSGEYSVHQTARGDLVIMSAAGILAAKRKGHWKIYDVYTFKNSIVDAISDTFGKEVESYRVGLNLFDVVFDLSFRRHGALLIYDPKQSVIEHVVNRGSILDPGEADAARAALSPSIAGIAMGAREYSLRKKRLLLELASVDGALVFTKGNILAVGAMIRTHSKANKEVGARSTAARSALYWGAFPVKVSADGEISIYFRSFNRARDKSCEAKFEFL